MPFKGAATLITMVDGRALLARRATPGLAMRARVVYEGEHFVHEEGLDAKLEHKPDPTVPHEDARHRDRGLCGGRVAGRSARSGWCSTGPTSTARAALAKTQRVWGSHYSAMAEKTALHRLLKRLPRMPGDPPDFDEVEQDAAPAQPAIVGPVRNE